MTYILPLLLLFCLSSTASADTVVPTRTIRANAVITDVDVRLASNDTRNGFDHVMDVIGQEARVALYPGRAILVDMIGPPALIDRNQIVALRFEGGGLLITTEGRSLERGGVGDRIRVMNLNSRNILFGLVTDDGSVRVTH